MKDDEARRSQGWLWASVVLSAIGVLVSGYLSIKRFTGGSLACTRWADCDVVNNSVYAKFYGVPVAFIGLAGYLVLMGLAMAALMAEGADQRRLLGLGFLLALGGFGFSVYLTYLELYIIEAICMWCVISALLITLLTILGGINLRRITHEPLDTSPTPSPLRP
ncbi:MAG: vitamin K epoxide reductase family protein [Candidatus Methylomirabilota bacterium]